MGWYNVAWRCAKEAEHRERALQILVDLVPLASEVMGSSHLLTITCMTTMARVLSYVRTKKESISVMLKAKQAIDQRYASFHPYRLEVLHRLALFLIDAHRVEDAEKILRGVIEQRVVVLGPHNVLTERSVKLLRKALQATGRHVNLDELKSELLAPSRISKMFEDAPSTAYLPLHSAV